MSRYRPRWLIDGFVLPLILLMLTGLSLWLLTIQYQLKQQQHRNVVTQIGSTFLWIAEQAQRHHQLTNKWPEQLRDVVDLTEFDVSITDLSASYQLTVAGEQLSIFYPTSDHALLSALDKMFSWLEIDAEGVSLTLAPVKIVDTDRLIHLQNSVPALQTNIDLMGHDVVNANKLNSGNLVSELAVLQNTRSSRVETQRLSIGPITLLADQLQGNAVVKSLTNSSEIKADRVISEQMTPQLAEIEKVLTNTLTVEKLQIEQATADYASVLNVQSQRLQSHRINSPQIDAKHVNTEQFAADIGVLGNIEANHVSTTQDVQISSARSLRELYQQASGLYQRLYHCMYVSEACFPAQPPVLAITCLGCDGLGTMNYYTSTLIISITGCKDTCDLRFAPEPRFHNFCENYVVTPQRDTSFTCNIRGLIDAGEQLNHPVTLYAMQSGDPRTEVSQTVFLTWRGI